MISIDILRLYVTVAETGSLASAARRLAVSPSLASRKLAGLEKSLNTRLMLRSTRSLRLTEAGGTFLSWAKETLAQFEQVVDELGFQRREPSGLVRISCNDYMSNRFLAEALQHFRRTYPGIRFVVTVSDRPLDLIEHGYDLAIHSGPAPDAALFGRRILAYERVVCANPSYLKGRRSPRSPAELTHHDCLLHSRADKSWFFKDSRGRVVEQPIAPVMEVNSYPLLLDLACRGLGVIRIAKILVRRSMNAGGLVELLGDYRCIERDGSDPEIWLTYPDRPRLSRVRLFAEYLTALLKTIDLPEA
jgi:DNA-binding transcriptional LysR family regulator